MTPTLEEYEEIYAVCCALVGALNRRDRRAMADTIVDIKKLCTRLAEQYPSDRTDELTLRLCDAADRANAKLGRAVGGVAS